MNQNFLDTKIIPETQYPLLKLLVFKVALHVNAQQTPKERVTRFYCKCLKPKRNKITKQTKSEPSNDVIMSTTAAKIQIY